MKGDEGRRRVGSHRPIDDQTLGRREPALIRNAVKHFSHGKSSILAVGLAPYRLKMLHSVPLFGCSGVDGRICVDIEKLEVQVGYA